MIIRENCHGCSPSANISSMYSAIAVSPSCSKDELVHFCLNMRKSSTKKGSSALDMPYPAISVVPRPRRKEIFSYTYGVIVKTGLVLELDIFKTFTFPCLSFFARAMRPLMLLSLPQFLLCARCAVVCFCLFLKRNPCKTVQFDRGPPRMYSMCRQKKDTLFFRNSRIF